MVESHVTLNDYHNLTRWLAWVAESGYAVDCKSIHGGSNPPPMLQYSGSTIHNLLKLTEFTCDSSGTSRSDE